MARYEPPEPPKITVNDLFTPQLWQRRIVEMSQGAFIADKILGPRPPLTRRQKAKRAWRWRTYGLRSRLASWIDPW